MAILRVADTLSAIPTPSECSLASFCTSDHGSDSEEEIICDNIDPRRNCPSRESISEHSIQEPHNSFVDSGAPAREAHVGQSPILMEYGQPLFVWLSRD